MIFIQLSSTEIVVHKLLDNMFVHHDTYGLQVDKVVPGSDISVVKDTISGLVEVTNVQYILDSHVHSLSEALRNLIIMFSLSFSAV